MVSPIFCVEKGEKLALYVEVYKMLINKIQKTLYKTVKK